MSEQEQQSSAAPLTLGGPAPDFTVPTTAGELTLSTWNPDKWVILFSHPADFTPVCTTEFAAFAARQERFGELNTVLLGCSVDGVHSHIAWLHSIAKNFNVDPQFPVIADLNKVVSKKYGMIHDTSGSTAPVRCVFFIDPKRTVRAMIYYPANVGRNFDEIERVLIGLQTADKTGRATPADWKPGDKLILPPPSTAEAAAQRVKEGQEGKFNVKEWYLGWEN